MDYHLVCVHPFGKYERGQMIADPVDVAILLEDREHNFVRIPIPVAEQVPDEPVPPEPQDPAVAQAIKDGQALTGTMAADKAALDRPWPAPQLQNSFPSIKEPREPNARSLTANRTCRAHYPGVYDVIPGSTSCSASP